jgi:ABC-type lipoprotein export system ATPase subunit
MEEEPAVALKKVSFAAQSAVIVQDVSISCREASATALVGPSGCGKSTVLKLSAGLLVPSGGVVYFRGRDIASMNRAQNLNFRREAAVVFQDSALWANQNLNQILDLPLRLHFPGMSARQRTERIVEAAAEVGYKRNLAVRPANLSVGEQKLIAFARAMICGPNLLFLDEWTESLDDDAAQRLITLVRKFKAAGKTIIFVSHDIRLIASRADCVIMIRDGQVALELELEGDQISKTAVMEQLALREEGL